MFLYILRIKQTQVYPDYVYLFLTYQVMEFSYGCISHPLQSHDESLFYLPNCCRRRSLGNKNHNNKITLGDVCHMSLFQRFRGGHPVCFQVTLYSFLVLSSPKHDSVQIGSKQIKGKDKLKHKESASIIKFIIHLVQHRAMSHLFIYLTFGGHLSLSEWYIQREKDARYVEEEYLPHVLTTANKTFISELNQALET